MLLWACTPPVGAKSAVAVKEPMIIIRFILFLLFVAKYVLHFTDAYPSDGNVPEVTLAPALRWCRCIIR